MILIQKRDGKILNNSWDILNTLSIKYLRIHPLSAMENAYISFKGEFISGTYMILLIAL